MTLSNDAFPVRPELRDAVQAVTELADYQPAHYGYAEALQEAKLCAKAHQACQAADTSITGLQTVILRTRRETQSIRFELRLKVGL